MPKKTESQVRPTYVLAADTEPFTLSMREAVLLKRAAWDGPEADENEQEMLQSILERIETEHELRREHAEHAELVAIGIVGGPGRLRSLVARVLDEVLREDGCSVKVDDPDPQAQAYDNVRAALSRARPRVTIAVRQTSKAKKKVKVKR